MFNKDKFKYELGTDVASGDLDKRVLAQIIGRATFTDREPEYLVKVTRLENVLGEKWVAESNIKLPE